MGFWRGSGARRWLPVIAVSALAGTAARAASVEVKLHQADGAPLQDAVLVGSMRAIPEPAAAGAGDHGSTRASVQPHLLPVQAGARCRSNTLSQKKKKKKKKKRSVVMFGLSSDRGEVWSGMFGLCAELRAVRVCSDEWWRRCCGGGEVVVLEAAASETLRGQNMAKNEKILLCAHATQPELPWRPSEVVVEMLACPCCPSTTLLPLILLMWFSLPRNQILQLGWQRDWYLLCLPAPWYQIN